MARTALTASQIDANGVAQSLSAANADGHSIAWRDGLFLTVANGSGSSITVTVQTPITVGGLAVADQTATVAAGTTVHISLDNAELYRQSDGAVYVDFSAVTSVTVQAFYV